MSDRVRFALKVVGLATAIAVVTIPLSGFTGLMLYIVLDPRMPADNLASFGLFFLPFVGLGLPMLIAAARLMLLGRAHGIQLAAILATLVLGTLGFAGFWVGAMGI